jgi:hypothetical protein
METVSIEAVFFHLKESVMKLDSKTLTLLAMITAVSAVVVWASNNVDSVEDYIG